MSKRKISFRWKLSNGWFIIFTKNGWRINFISKIIFVFWWNYLNFRKFSLFFTFTSFRTQTFWTSRIILHLIFSERISLFLFNRSCHNRRKSNRLFLLILTFIKEFKNTFWISLSQISIKITSFFRVGKNDFVKY